MGLTQHHHSNTIHELAASGDRLKTKTFTMFNFLFVQMLCMDSDISLCHLALFHYHTSYLTLISPPNLTAGLDH